MHRMKCSFYVQITNFFFDLATVAVARDVDVVAAFEWMETGRSFKSCCPCTGSHVNNARYAFDSRSRLSDDGSAHGSVVQKDGCCFGGSPKLARPRRTFTESEPNTSHHAFPAPAAAEGGFAQNKREAISHPTKYGILAGSAFRILRFQVSRFKLQVKTGLQTENNLTIGRNF